MATATSLSRSPAPVSLSGPRRRRLDVQSDEPQRRLKPRGGKEPDYKARRDAKRKERLLDDALRCWELANIEPEKRQRERELEDAKFDRGLREDQWPEAILNARKGGRLPDGSSTPEQPCLVIPKGKQAVRQIVNEGREARLAIRVKPKPGKGTTKGAAVRQGIIRAIEDGSRATIARMWAYERAVKVGRGFYRILKTYANDGDMELDLVIKRIPNQASVYLDPFAQEPDWSDGQWAFITSDLSKKEYERLYGDKAPEILEIEEGDDTFTSINDSAPGWLSDKAIRVAEFFYIKWTKKVLFVDELTGQSRYLRRGEQLPEGTVTWRDVQVPSVHWCLMNAMQIIDEEPWQGRYIPIIAVISEEHNVNGERSWKGVYGDSKDALRGYNVMRSVQLEEIGMLPRNPVLIPEGADEDYEDEWDNMNTRPMTRVHYKPKNHENGDAAPPMPMPRNSNLEAVTLAVREFDADIKATTGRHAPSLGELGPERSGKAIERLMAQGAFGSSHNLDQFATVSLAHEGRVLLDLMKYVYTSKGRILRVIGEEKGKTNEQDIMIGQNFIRHPQSGEPIAEEEADFPFNPEDVEFYDLTKGEYLVTASAGSSHQTEREETSAVAEGLIKANPAFAGVIGDIVAEATGTPGGEQIAERIRAVNGMGDADIPPAAQAKITQMQQQMQEMGQQLSQLQFELKANKLKVDADLQIGQLRIASEERQAAQKQRLEAIKVRATLDSKEALEQLKGEEERLTQEADHAHELVMQARDHQHERRKIVAGAVEGVAARSDDAAHDREMHDRQAADTRDMHDRESATAREQQEREGELTREMHDRDRAAAREADARQAAITLAKPPADGDRG